MAKVASSSKVTHEDEAMTGVSGLMGGLKGCDDVIVGSAVEAVIGEKYAGTDWFALS